MGLNRLRKSLPVKYATLVLPSDDAIDWAATAKIVTEDETYFAMLKELSFPDMDLEEVKAKFVGDEANGKKGAAKMTIFDYYRHKSFDSDKVVALEGQKLIKLVFRDFSVSDISILSKNSQAVSVLMSVVKGEKMDNKALGEAVVGILKDPELTKVVKQAIASVLDAKLERIDGIDADITREEAIEAIADSLQYHDVMTFIQFVRASVNMTIEKKSISQS